MDGTVVKVLQDKRFGFIRSPDGEEFFFHETDITNAEITRFKIGTKVTFTATATPKGARAAEVTWVD